MADDAFGSPDGNARNGTTPVELQSGLLAASLPSRLVNPLGHTQRAQYDYHLGRPVDIEDASGVVSSV